MKINDNFSTIGTNALIVVLLFWASSIHAQTFKGAKQLTETPKYFGVLIYPVASRPQTIRINFDNPAGAMVRIVIKHQSGTIVYDEYKNVVASREYFDLSALPAGEYIVDLSTQYDHITKLFTINSAQAGYITMETPTIQVIPRVSNPNTISCQTMRLASEMYSIK